MKTHNGMLRDEDWLDLLEQMARDYPREDLTPAQQEALAKRTPEDARALARKIVRGEA